MTKFIYDGPSEYAKTIDYLQEKIKFEGAFPKGGSGYVLYGRHKLLDRSIVVKFYYWQRGTYVEPNRLSQFDHPNILKVYDAAAIDDNYAYYITERCDCGDLDDLLQQKKLPPKKAVALVCEVASGVSEIHSKGLVHRDLKPQNIFVTSNGTATIGDFGSVIDLEGQDEKFSRTRHELLYRPPEGFLDTYCKASDIYQLGLLTFQLLGGNFPYDIDAHLNKRQLNDAKNLSSFDLAVFKERALREKIDRQRLIDIKSLPPWSSTEKSRRLIRKATAPNPSLRHRTVSEFLTKLHECEQEFGDWDIDTNHIILRRAPTSFRITLEPLLIVEKMRTGTSWRKDNSFTGHSLEDAVSHVMP